MQTNAPLAASRGGCDVELKVKLRLVDVLALQDP